MTGPSREETKSPNDRAHEGDPPSPQAQGEDAQVPQEGGHGRGQEAGGQALAELGGSEQRGREQHPDQGEGEDGGPQEPPLQAGRLVCRPRHLDAPARVTRSGLPRGRVSLDLAAEPL